MGMHFGLLGLNCPREPALNELRRHAGEFREAEAFATSFPGPEWVRVTLDEHRGRTTLADSTCMLTGLRPDLIVALSANLREPLVAYYAETTSGSFGFVVAQAGKLLRLYHACHFAWSQPISIGEPLRFESGVDLEALDGSGAVAALGHFGFVDPDRTDFSQERLYWCRPNIVKGELQQLIADHESRYAIPVAQRPQPRVVARVVENPADPRQA
jgi:hypothetical protein